MRTRSLIVLHSSTKNAAELTNINARFLRNYGRKRKYIAQNSSKSKIYIYIYIHTNYKYIWQLHLIIKKEFIKDVRGNGLFKLENYA